MEFSAKRQQLVTWVERHLCGDYYQLGSNSPLDDIHLGFLYPQIDLKKEQHNPVVHKSVPPSSVGFSFFATGKEIDLEVSISADRFFQDDDNSDGKGKEWHREKLAPNDYEVLVFTKPTSTNSVESFRVSVLNERATVTVLWRQYKNGFLVTLSLENAQTSDSSRQQKDINQKTLFGVKFQAEIIKGLLQKYPTKEPSLLSEEEREIEFRYRNIKIYGIGHAAAVDWYQSSNGNMVLATSFTPKVEVPNVTANTAGGYDNTLNFKYLSSLHKESNVLPTLHSFIQGYEDWITQQSKQLSGLTNLECETADKLAAKMSLAKERMNLGLEFLERDEDAKIAFSYANMAMLKQMNPNKNLGDIDVQKFCWRPFQLAFILMSLESVVNEDSDYRDIVDLIWFPTGGGKTEAYLGVVAFLFVYRRLKYTNSSGGTVAIMRYTLRLLTAQQFLRAAKVVSALEILRRKNPVLLGSEPFSLGLWVGQSSTPNNINQVKELISDGKFKSLGVSSCPWCKSDFKRENYVLEHNAFYFKCTNKTCEFGGSVDTKLPFNTVDEELYKHPPTLLLATVDKFARLAWEERAASFFGIAPNRPPELIIQDELHLISSELGSVVGLYEVGIETALALRHLYPKYIASTATIKNAETQVRLLYGREMAMFPPAGFSHDDSYFAKTVPTEKKPGRLYIGYMAYNRKQNKSIEPLAALLLAAPNKLFYQEKDYMDAWWTQMVYHGSLKGVGTSQTAYSGGVLEHLGKLSQANMAEEQVSLYRNLTVESLTSNQGADKNNDTFKALESSYKDKQSIDVALATNMVSVGLDVERLALMIISGQPLTTAEYIQASSRVGRGDVPGIVFVNYHKSQARSLSHYENFKSYHESFYRYVEPTSITPFTEQAISRAMHASLVIAIRMGGLSLSSNASADNFCAESTEIKNVVKLIGSRLRSAIQGPFSAGFDEELEKRTFDNAILSLGKCIDEWQEAVKLAKSERRQLFYSSQDKSANSLLKPFEKVGDEALWPTLTSMRSVEKSALIKM